MSELQWTAVVLGAGVGTYMLRAAPFLWKKLLQWGRVYVRPLTYVSFAVAAGIISRATFVSAGHLSFGLATWVKVLAVAVSVVIYRATRNMPVSLFSAVGIAVLAFWLAGQLSGLS